MATYIYVAVIIILTVYGLCFYGYIMFNIFKKLFRLSFINLEQYKVFTKNKK